MQESGIYLKWLASNSKMKYKENMNLVNYKFAEMKHFQGYVLSVWHSLLGYSHLIHWDVPEKKDLFSTTLLNITSYQAAQLKHFYGLFVVCAIMSAFALKIILIEMLFKRKVKRNDSFINNNQIKLQLNKKEARRQNHLRLGSSSVNGSQSKDSRVGRTISN